MTIENRRFLLHNSSQFTEHHHEVGVLGEGGREHHHEVGVLGEGGGRGGREGAPP